jgi:hypothetical protein
MDDNNSPTNPMVGLYFFSDLLWVLSFCRTATSRVNESLRGNNS